MLLSPAPSQAAASPPSAEWFSYEPWPKLSGDQQHKLLPCGWTAVVSEAMVPQLSVIEYMEGGSRDTPVLWGSTIMEVTFKVVDQPQRVAGAVEYQKFDNGAFLSSKRSLEGLRRLQELIIGVEALQHIGEHNFHLLLPCPYASAGIHCEKGT
jgi:hypothetical protein